MASISQKIFMMSFNVSPVIKKHQMEVRNVPLQKLEGCLRKRWPTLGKEGNTFGEINNGVIFYFYKINRGRQSITNPSTQPVGITSGRWLPKSISRGLHDTVTGGYVTSMH